MAWFDIAAGLAQGAQQGIDRVQADQVRRKADAFKDAQEKRALAAEARLVDQDAQQKIAEFINRSDPSNLDPAEVQKFGAAGQPYFTKATDGSGRIIARENPLATKKRAYDAMVMDDAPNEFKAKVAERQLRGQKTATESQALSIMADGELYDKQTDANKLKIGKNAGFTLEEIAPSLSPAYRQKLREMTPAYIGGTLNVEAARESAAGQDRRLDKQTASAMAIAQLREAGDNVDRQQAAIAGYARALISDDASLAQNEPELMRQLGAIVNAAKAYAPRSPGAAPVVEDQAARLARLLRESGVQ